MCSPFVVPAIHPREIKLKMKSTKDWKEARQKRIDDSTNKMKAIEEQKTADPNAVWKFPEKMPGKDTTYSSIWLSNPLAEQIFKDRLSEEGLSEFNPFVAKSIISYWSKPDALILDPFAGRTRGIVSALMGRRYLGYELSKKAYDCIMGEVNKFNLQVDIKNEDCINIKDIDVEADLILSCPPYHDLERYESIPGQLSDINDYKEFLAALEERIKACVPKLKEEGYAAFVVGDFRKNGDYILFHKDFIELAERCGLKLYDLVVLQNVQFGVALHRFGSVRDLKMMAKAHEYLLIFKKKKNDL
jgi:DNA modification methylase